MIIQTAIAEHTIAGWLGPGPADWYTEALGDRTATAGPQ